MYYNLFIKRNCIPAGIFHYLVWDEYRSKKAAKNAARYFNKRYYTYVKTISIPPCVYLDDGTTMEHFPVTSYNCGRITYDK